MWMSHLELPSNLVIQALPKLKKCKALPASLRRMSMLSDRLEQLLERVERWRQLEQQIADNEILEAIRADIVILEGKIAGLELQWDKP
jgi:hypothetical protein